VVEHPPPPTKFKDGSDRINRINRINRIYRIFVFPFLPLRKRGKKLNPATPEGRYPRPITPYHAESTLLCFPTKSGLLLDSFFRELAKATKKHPEDPAVPSEMPLGFYFTGVNPVGYVFSHFVLESQGMLDRINRIHGIFGWALLFPEERVATQSGYAGKDLSDRINRINRILCLIFCLSGREAKNSIRLRRSKSTQEQPLPGKSQ
jgi:hypothetical protein